MTDTTMKSRISPLNSQLRPAYE